jgi:hypothetical protein
LAAITIKLRYNKRTGKKDIVIEYESEEDMTGWEHEKEHKRIVEELVGKGVLEDEEFGQVIRVKPGESAEEASGEATANPEAQPQAEPQGT